MNTKRLTTIFFGVILVVSMAGQAQAVPMGYDLFGNFYDGGELSGTMTIDSDRTAFTDPIGPVTEWNLTTSLGSSMTGYTYNSLNSFVGWNGKAFTFFGATDRALTFLFYDPLLSVPSDSYTIKFIGEAGDSTTRFGKNASVIANPEPSTLLLLGSGLAALGAWRYRKSKKA